jgi:Fic family protein
MRSYQTTHPWITFKFDLNWLQSEDWRLLGEARSKCDHIAGTPLLPPIAASLAKVYLAKGVNSTTAIEGNTLSEAQVLEHIDGKLLLPKSQEYQKQEIDNILKACDEILNQIKSGESLTLTADSIRRMNRQILKDIKHENWIVPGEIRDRAIAAGMYRGPAYEDCEYLLNRFCEWIDPLDLMKDEPQINGILKAIIAHICIVWIHPFGDGNGRTARLVEHQILIRSGIPAPATNLLSNHYNLTRSQYYDLLEETSINGGNLQPFINYALRGFVDGLLEQLTSIREFQTKMIWINYIYYSFSESSSTVGRRQRLLALEISEHTEGIKITEVPNLSRKITEAYSKLTDKAISRDISRLIKMNLVYKQEKKLFSNRDSIRAFLPVKALH